MGSTPDFRKAFVARLIQACNDSTVIPEQGRGRQNYIAAMMKVAPEAVSKWFKGVSMPRPDKMEALTELLGVDQSWLAFGVKAEMDRTQRRVHAKESSGAVHLVWGVLTLTGGHCGEPAATDPRASYVDFYATLRGSVYPIHVSLARELDSGDYEVTVPREYADVHTIAVIPAGHGEFRFLSMLAPIVDAHRVKKGGDFAVTVTRGRGRYFSGNHTWPSVKSFDDLIPTLRLPLVG